MDQNKWFWRGVVGLVSAVMMMSVSHVSRYVSESFFGAGIITVNTFEKAFVPEVGEAILTSTVELLDHDGRSAFQNSVTGPFAARVGTPNAALNFLSSDISTKITNSTGEVLRYLGSAGTIVGTFYLGVTEVLPTEVFDAFVAPAGDAISSLTADTNNIVYAIINTPAVQPRLESFTVDFSTGALTQTGVSTLLPGALPAFGEILFHNGILYYVNNTSLFTVTVSGTDFIFTDTGVVLAVASTVREFHGVTLNAAPRAGFDFLFIVDSFVFPQTVHAVQRTSGGVFSLFDLDTIGPNTFYTPTGAVVDSDEDYSFTVETQPPPASTASFSDPLIVFVGPGNTICGRNVITEVESCNDNAGAVFWVDTGRDLGTVLFETGAGVNITTRFDNGGVADFTDAPFAPFAPGQSFVVFEDDFGVSGTFPDTPVWHQQALTTSGRIDTAPLFFADGFRDVDITGNLISSTPVVMDVFWGQNGGAFPGVADSTVVAPGPFVINLVGVHVDSRLGEIFRFDFPIGSEFLVSDIQITAKINTDSAFLFGPCFVQDGIGDTPVEVSVVDVEGDVGAVTIDGVAAVCAANICTAPVPAIPVGVYPLTFAAIATDTRGNVSAGTSQVNIRIVANGGTCGGGGRRIVGALGNNNPPVILVSASDPLEVFEGEKIKFDVTGLDEDINDQLKMYFIGDPTRQFAEGFRAVFKPLQKDSFLIKSSLEWQTQIGMNGRYAFQFEVLDNTSLRSEKTVFVDVVSLPPPEAPAYTISLDVSPLEDQYSGVVSLSSELTTVRGLEEVPRNYETSDYPLLMERCIRATGVNYSQIVDCESLQIFSSADSFDLTRLSSFDATYFLPTTVQTFAFQAHFEISSEVNEDAPRFLYEASSPFVLWKPEMLISDGDGNALQNPLNLTSLDEIFVSSRWKDVQFTLDDKRARNRLISPSVDASDFIPYQEGDQLPYFQWKVFLGLEGELCIRLFQKSSCYDLFSPEKEIEEVASDVEIDEPIRIDPSQYIYPSYRIQLNERTESVVSLFAVTESYRGDEAFAVTPDQLSIVLKPIGFELNDIDVERRANGYPSLSAVVPRGVQLNLEFIALFDEGPYVYKTERISTSSDQEIVRGTEELSPLLKQITEISKQSSSPEKEGFVRLSPDISLRAPTQKFTPRGLSFHGVAQAKTLRVCLLDMQTGQIIEGNNMEIAENGTFYGEAANEQLPKGEYSSVLFADVSAPCTDLMRSWFLLEEKDPSPFILEVTDSLFGIDVLEYIWSGTAKTSLDPLESKAYDLTNSKDFLVDVSVQSPYTYRSELYVEVLETGYARVVPLDALGTNQLSVYIPGLSYGLHTMLVYAVLETGEKTPDVLIPFEYGKKGELVLHGSAPDVSWMWLMLLLAIVMMVIVWRMGRKEKEYDDLQSLNAQENGNDSEQVNDFEKNVNESISDETPREEGIEKL
ncbi:MAG: hypothetical protein P1V18_04380 [Candidatus Gracilibacteria bacterium]|nr:hypothetical protein [Candidatus Gracilibacteria bacterium]